ncbi:transcriptional regulator [Lentzea sp. NBRC 105346]|uniref:AAA family ATPase n=1 Tax=Lentzea sp. NBRC 105346 TaxID=3032205 RepID=UPI0024A1AE7C|nr:AAA family ATPase [Lentzea sp. NBRC 105346]GLZ29008.1 transcriptional regulator [Lentzea sp. NBRC 105346]
MTVLTTPDDRWSDLLVERRDALALADRVADDLARGRSSLVHVKAPPGGGLTAVLGEVAGRARERGARVTRCRCSPDEASVQFRAAWQFLGALEIDEPTGAPEAVADVVMPLCHAVLEQAQQRPVVIVVDDAQWIDRASFELLRALVRRMDHAPIVLAVGASVLCPSMTITAELESCSAVTHDVRLSRLTRTGVGEIAAAAFPEPADDAFLDALVTHTKGLPAVLHRVVTWLVRNGVVPDTAAVPRVADLATSVIRDRLDLRIRALSPASRRLLHVIAVCDGVFSAQEAAAMAGLSREFAREVDVLGASGLLVQRWDPKPSHALVVDRVLALATRAEREELHAKAAELAHRAALDDEVVARLLLGTGPIGAPWALTVLRGTAKYHLQRGAHREAVRLLDRALAEPVTMAERAHLLVECGAVETTLSPDAGDRRLTAALATTGGQEIARSRLAAVDLLLARGNCDLVKQAIVSVHTRQDLDPGERDTMCALYWMADEAPHDQREFSPAALPPLPDEPTEPAQAAVAAWETVTEGRDIERARRLARTALAAPVRESLLYPRIVAARVLFHTDDYGESIAAFDDVVLEASRRQVPATAGWALLHRAKAFLRQGVLGDAAIDIERAVTGLPLECWHPAVRPAFVGVELAMVVETGRLGQAERIAATEFPPTAKAGFSWVCFEFGRGLVYLSEGDAAHAATIFEETGRRMLARRWTNPALLPWRSLCAIAYRGCGRHEEAARMCADELRLSRRWGDASSIGSAHLGAAVALQGQESLAHMEQAVEILRNAPARLRYATALVELGEARLHTGAAGDARTLLVEAERVAAAHGATGLASRARGLIASGN